MFDGHKDLLGIKDLTPLQINKILDTAQTMKYVFLKNGKTAGQLKGKSVVTMFYENSTRTRLSFELAAKYMGATAAGITASGSSVSKGETLIDTAKTIDQMGTDIIVMRHQASGAPHLVAKNVKSCVINAGDGMNEHPTQALLDMFTMREKKETLSGLKVAIIGDVSHSRVARSNIYGLTKMGASVSIGAPATLIPSDIDRNNIEVYNSVQEAIVDADVVIGLRMQLERQKSGLYPSNAEYARFFGIDRKRLSLAKENVLLLHPGPVNRGVELSSDVIDGDLSAINEQVTNGVAIRMAIMYLFTSGERKKDYADID